MSARPTRRLGANGIQFDAMMSGAKQLDEPSNLTLSVRLWLSRNGGSCQQYSFPPFAHERERTRPSLCLRPRARRGRHGLHALWPCGRHRHPVLLGGRPGSPGRPPRGSYCRRSFVRWPDPLNPLTVIKSAKIDIRKTLVDGVEDVTATTRIAGAEHFGEPWAGTLAVFYPAPGPTGCVQDHYFLFVENGRGKSVRTDWDNGLTGIAYCQPIQLVSTSTLDVLAQIGVEQGDDAD